MNDSKLATAILYQAQKPPVRDGIIKPMKPNGYSDSGADIAYTLKKQNYNIITPITNPDPEKDFDWLFPDTKEGIEKAIELGAKNFWVNTVLFSGHPIEEFIKKGFSVIGQKSENVDKYDDKFYTNSLLAKNNLPIPKSLLITEKNKSDQLDFNFPLIIKPIRGRGSEGVFLINDQTNFDILLNQIFKEGKYGTSLYIEEFLSGKEITITVMPPGNYLINGEEKILANHWSLPPVERFNHINGVAPYNGIVAVVNNSKVLDDQEIKTQEIQKVLSECEIAAKLVDAKAPIRIDCRANNQGNYFIFDLNMKPNMTGASRLHRLDQNSLTVMAAEKIDWSFADFLINIFRQKWNK